MKIVGKNRRQQAPLLRENVYGIRTGSPEVTRIGKSELGSETNADLSLRSKALRHAGEKAAHRSSCSSHCRNRL